MADPIKRLRYFDHQFLHANDFTDEQSYELSMRRRHNRTLHTPGIADGLDVSFKSGETKVTVQPGTAYDGDGNEIVVLDITDVDLQSLASDATGYLTVKYNEVATDKVNSAGVNDFTRVTETPVFEFDTKLPTKPTMSLLLAVVTRQGKQVTKLDPSARLIAGARAGDLVANSLSIRVDQFGSNAWPKLSTAPIPQTQNLLTSLTNTSLQLDAGKEIILFDGGVVRSNDSAYRLGFNSQGKRLELQTGGDITFLSGGTERMRLLGAGRLGIGTPAPDQPLTIQSATNAFMNFKANNGANVLQVGADNTGGIISTTTNHDLQLRAGKDTPMLTIKAGGNVGVGVTAPDYRLDVGDRMRIRQGASGDATLSFYQTAPATDVASLGMFTDKQVGLYSNKIAQWGLLMDLNTNNIGFGVAPSNFKLDISDRIRLRQGTSAGAGIAFYQNTPATDVAYLSMSGDTLLGVWSSKLGKFIWQMDLTTGNVGIGTAPLANSPLVVAGITGYNTSPVLTGSTAGGTALTIENTATGGHRYDLISTGANNLLGAGGFGIYDETTNSFRLSILANGNVGVNTNTPATKFHIHGDYSNNGKGGFALDATDSGNPEQYILRINPYSPGTTMVGYQFETKSTVGGTNVPLTFDHAGRVGIGNTAPKTQLDVQGAANIWADTRLAATNNSMAPGSLIIGSTTRNYGGGTNYWNNNMAGLLFECQDNTEIAVHDSGTRVASMMYYESAANRVSIGRDMGWGTLSALALNGSISHPQWRVTQLFNMTRGPLPITSGQFTSGGGTSIIFVTGSGWANSVSVAGAGVYIDLLTNNQLWLGNMYRWFNETNTHKTLVGNPIVARIPAGTHTLSFYAWNGLVSDANDYYSATILELPF